MSGTLDACAPLGFSKTAGSRPRHSEAGRRTVGCGALAVLRRRTTDDLPKRPAERAEAREADVEANLGDGAVALAQHEHRALDAAALQVAVRRLAKRRPKRADEVGLRYVRDPRQRRDV